MKIRHLYSFFCRCLCFFPFSHFVFVRNYSFCNIRQWDKSCFTCNIIPNKRALFPFIKTSNNSAPQTTIKQARFYKPCIYDKQLDFNKTAVVIWDSLFADSGICVLTIVCAICDIRSRSGFGTNTPQIAGARHKQALIKNYCFYDQTTQNYSTANNPLRFLQHKNSIRHYLTNDLTCAARKTTFRTRKRFHNKQYTPKSKDQTFESDRTHFDTVFNNGSIAMHRPTFIFLLSHKITTVQQKTTNRNNQSRQTIQNLSINNTLKTKHNKQTRKTISSINRKINHKNNHNKQSKISQSKPRQNKHNKQLRKNAMFLNIKIIAVWFAADKYFPEPTSKYSLLIKPQCNRTRKNHGQQHYEIIYYKHEKETFYIFG